MNFYQTDDQQMMEDYRRIERAIHFLEENFRRQPELEEIAASVSLSVYHFQRLFTRWVGISPKRFLQYLTKEYAKELLHRSENLLAVTYESGLSSPGRLHDLFVATEAVTPGEFKTHGAGLTIQYGFHPTPFGEVLIARTPRGICNLSFVGGERRPLVMEQFFQRWGKAEMHEDPGATRSLVEKVFNRTQIQPGEINVVLAGTNFQIKVWEALLRIPSGAVVSYEDVAVMIGMPLAARAVSNAVASNPIAVLVPCHRVIRKDGDFGGYSAGKIRKKALLGWEQALQERAAARI